MKRMGLSANEKSNLLGIPVIFIFGSLFHFLYAWSGRSAIVGAIAAVNESVWEHQKLILIPMIGWWTLYFLFRKGSNQIDPQRWFTALLVSLIVSILVIPFAYYFYTGSLGVHLLVIDILIFLLAVAVGQYLGMHFYRHSEGLPINVSIVTIVLIVLLFIAFTFAPPHLPWFKESLTGRYGIY